MRLLSAMRGASRWSWRGIRDVINVDLHLPEVGGEEVMRMRKADSRSISIPVVVLGADATRHQMERLRPMARQPISPGRRARAVTGNRGRVHRRWGRRLRKRTGLCNRSPKRALPMSAPPVDTHTSGCTPISDA